MATVSQPPAAVTAPQKTTHPFTCMTCSIAFRSGELQRTHMRSDWHRYNLKRRVASLPPLASEVFAEKVLSAQASSKAAADKASFEKHCAACSKTYFSENAFRNHLGSQRHRMNEAIHSAAANADDASVVSSVVASTINLGSEPVAPEDVEDPAVTAEFQEVINSMKDSRLEESTPVSRRPSRPHHSAELERRAAGGEGAADTASAHSGTAASTATGPMPKNRCMFCNVDSVNLEANVMHMGKSHGLFVPEKEFLDDLEGLVTYLQAKVSQNMECICCHKLKNTVSGIQTHMRDKSHCRIAFETEDELLEIGQFYDFRATYSDDSEDDDGDSSEDGDDDDEDKKKTPRGARLGAARKAKTAADSDDEEWEDDEDEDEDEDDDSDDNEDNEDDKDGAEGRVGPTKKGLRQPAAAQAFEADGELYLPSGRTAGHRSGARYYRQNLRNYGEDRPDQKLLTEGDGDTTTTETASQRNAERALAARKARESSRSQLVSRADGGWGMRGVGAAARREVVRTEERERRKMLRAMQRRIGMVAAKQTKRMVIHNTTFA